MLHKASPLSMTQMSCTAPCTLRILAAGGGTFPPGGGASPGSPGGGNPPGGAQTSKQALLHSPYHSALQGILVSIAYAIPLYSRSIDPMCYHQASGITQPDSNILQMPVDAMFLEHLGRHQAPECRSELLNRTDTFCNSPLLELLYCQASALQ